MFASKLSFALACAFALLTTVVAADAPAQVLTAQRIYHTVIKESPYLIDKTTTVVWTQSPSIIEEAPAQTGSA